MNQETSRNDLKDQIKEIRATNSEIKRKAIDAIIYRVFPLSNLLHLPAIQI